MWFGLQKMKKYIFILLTLHLACGEEERKSKYPPFKFNRVEDITQQDAVQALVERTLRKASHLFKVFVDSTLNNDTFQIFSNGNGTVFIKGNSAVDVATGLNYYLKYYCNSQISWQNRQINLPTPLPAANEWITFNDRYRYYQNICTSSYSFVWWKWKQWEKHIDWIALNGFNVVLAPNGQEIIWKKLYKELGMTEEEINEHFTGPAFLAWNRMGNLRIWGGPLSDGWHNRSAILQSQVLFRMQSLGIVTVLPGFAGHVPRAFKRLFPEANMTEMSQWSNFNKSYCCPYLLDPQDSLFATIGRKYYALLNALYGDYRNTGSNTIYSADIFNEMSPTSTNLTYLARIGNSVYSAMLEYDSGAIWLMQGWLFYNDPFWTKERARALITSVPQGKMVILDLQSEQFPQYKRLDSYFGQPFIWCMLHNFGGTLGMFGSADIINTEPFQARQTTTMIGIGLTPEGINQNYVIYDLMSEMAWRKESANLVEWFGNYSSRRYGAVHLSTNETWQVLKNTVYNFSGSECIRGKYSITTRPTLTLRKTQWYNSSELYRAFSLFLKAYNVFSDVETYKYDAVDLTRQVLQELGDEHHIKIVNAYRNRRVYEFQWAKRNMLEILDDLELLLRSNRHFLLGKWIQDAKKTASSLNERDQFELNARNQISLWGPNGEIHDYANKQWAGVVSEYFEPRWQIFLTELEESLLNKTVFNETAVVEKMFWRVEKPFTYSTKKHISKPKGNPVDIARFIQDKWTIKGELNFEGTLETLRSRSPVSEVEIYILRKKYRKRKICPFR